MAAGDVTSRDPAELQRINEELRSRNEELELYNMRLLNQLEEKELQIRALRTAKQPTDKSLLVTSQQVSNTVESVVQNDSNSDHPEQQTLDDTRHANPTIRPTSNIPSADSVGRKERIQMSSLQSFHELSKKLQKQTLLVQSLVQILNSKQPVQDRATHDIKSRLLGNTCNSAENTSTSAFNSLSIQIPSLILPDANYNPGSRTQTIRPRHTVINRARGRSPIDHTSRHKTKKDGVSTPRQTTPHSLHSISTRRTDRQPDVTTVSCREFSQNKGEQHQQLSGNGGQTKSINLASQCISNSREKQCPCCFKNCNEKTQQQFEDHVVNCLEGKLYRESEPRETEISVEELRTCPICTAVVPHELGQEEYEMHVLRHLDVAEMQYEEVHRTEAECIPIS